MNKEEMVQIIAADLKNILVGAGITLGGDIVAYDKDYHKEQLKKAMSEVDNILIKYKKEIDELGITPMDIVKATGNKLPILVQGTVAPNGVVLNKVVMDDVLIAEKRNIKAERTGLFKNKISSPEVFIPLCNNVLMVHYRNSFKEAKEMVSSINERHIIINKTYQMITTFRWDDKYLYFNEFHLFISGDIEKAKTQFNEHLERDLEEAGAVVQLNPISELNRVIMAIRIDKGFVGAIYKFNDDLEISKLPEEGEVFGCSSEMKEYIESLYDSYLKGLDKKKGHMWNVSNN